MTKCDWTYIPQEQGQGSEITKCTCIQYMYKVSQSNGREVSKILKGTSLIREYDSTLYVGMALKNMAAYTFQLQVVS